MAEHEVIYILVTLHFLHLFCDKRKDPVIVITFYQVIKGTAFYRRDTVFNLSMSS